MAADTGVRPAAIRADGGLVANKFVCQFIADILDTALEIPRVTETTALGAAYLAGLQAGIYEQPEDFQKIWALERRFTPAMNPVTRDAKYARWGRAVAATMAV